MPVAKIPQNSIEDLVAVVGSDIMSPFQDVVFPDFKAEEETVIPLPGKLEALPILDLVTKANRFPVSTMYMYM